jgi:predicted NBD/HSP70 family sugar kinase
MADSPTKALGDRMNSAESLEPVEVNQSVDGAYSVGVVISQTQLTGVLVDLDGNIVDSRSAAAIPGGSAKVILRRRITKSDVATVVSDVAELTEELLRTRPEYRKKVIGLGVSVGGYVDSQTGVVRFSPSLAWLDVQLAQLLASATGLDLVLIENDAKVLADAEQWKGLSYKWFAVVTIGDGIGCGYVLNSELQRGSSGLAAELGHIPFEIDGQPCVCGNRGCLQTVASPGAILRAVQEDRDLSLQDMGEVVALAKGGDKIAQRAFERAGDALGWGLAVLVNILDPEAIVLCGELAVLNSPIYVEAARASLYRHAFPTSGQDCEILVEVRTDELQASGAASMVFDHLVDLRTSQEGNHEIPRVSRADQSRRADSS